MEQLNKPGFMTIVYALLITLVVYPLLGTFLFFLVEKMNMPIKAKVFILSLGHPILAGIIVWFGCLMFSREIAETAVLLVAGSLLRLPFSGRKYFQSLMKDPEIIIINYVTPIMRMKSVRIPLTAMQELSYSKSKNFIDKPSRLTIKFTDQIITIDILNKHPAGLVI
ncbi:MAG TPA: hypothetical protein VF476_13030 [Chitinophagaceae bacterium]